MITDINKLQQDIRAIGSVRSIQMNPGEIFPTLWHRYIVYLVKACLYLGFVWEALI